MSEGQPKPAPKEARAEGPKAPAGTAVAEARPTALDRAGGASGPAVDAGNPGAVARINKLVAFDPGANAGDRDGGNRKLATDAGPAPTPDAGTDSGKADHKGKFHIRKPRLFSKAHGKHAQPRTAHLGPLDDRGVNGGSQDVASSAKPVTAPELAASATGPPVEPPPVKVSSAADLPPQSSTGTGTEKDIVIGGALATTQAQVAEAGGIGRAARKHRENTEFAKQRQARIDARTKRYDITDDASWLQRKTQIATGAIKGAPESFRQRREAKAAGIEPEGQRVRQIVGQYAQLVNEGMRNPGAHKVKAKTEMAMNLASGADKTLSVSLRDSLDHLVDAQIAQEKAARAERGIVHRATEKTKDAAKAFSAAATLEITERSKRQTQILADMRTMVEGGNYDAAVAKYGEDAMKRFVAHRIGSSDAIAQVAQAATADEVGKAAASISRIRLEGEHAKAIGDLLSPLVKKRAEELDADTEAPTGFDRQLEILNLTTALQDLEAGRQVMQQNPKIDAFTFATMLYDSTPQLAKGVVEVKNALAGSGNTIAAATKEFLGGRAVTLEIQNAGPEKIDGIQVKEARVLAEMVEMWSEARATGNATYEQAVNAAMEKKLRNIFKATGKDIASYGWKSGLRIGLKQGATVAAVTAIGATGFAAVPVAVAAGALVSGATGYFIGRRRGGEGAAADVALALVGTDRNMDLGASQAAQEAALSSDATAAFIEKGRKEGGKRGLKMGVIAGGLVGEGVHLAEHAAMGVMERPSVLPPEPMPASQTVADSQPIAATTAAVVEHVSPAMQPVHGQEILVGPNHIPVILGQGNSYDNGAIVGVNDSVGILKADMPKYEQLFSQLQVKGVPADAKITYLYNSDNGFTMQVNGVNVAEGIQLNGSQITFTELNGSFGMEHDNVAGIDVPTIKVTTAGTGHEALSKDFDPKLPKIKDTDPTYTISNNIIGERKFDFGDYRVVDGRLVTKDGTTVILDKTQFKDDFGVLSQMQFNNKDGTTIDSNLRFSYDAQDGNWKVFNGQEEIAKLHVDPTSTHKDPNGTIDFDNSLGSMRKDAAGTYIFSQNPLQNPAAPQLHPIHLSEQQPVSATVVEADKILFTENDNTQLSVTGVTLNQEGDIVSSADPTKVLLPANEVAQVQSTLHLVDLPAGKQIELKYDDKNGTWSVYESGNKKALVTDVKIDSKGDFTLHGKAVTVTLGSNGVLEFQQSGTTGAPVDHDHHRQTRRTHEPTHRRVPRHEERQPEQTTSGTTETHPTGVPENIVKLGTHFKEVRYENTEAAQRLHTEFIDPNTIGIVQEGGTHITNFDFWVMGKNGEPVHVIVPAQHVNGNAVFELPLNDKSSVANNEITVNGQQMTLSQFREEFVNGKKFEQLIHRLPKGTKDFATEANDAQDVFNANISAVHIHDGVEIVYSTIHGSGRFPTHVTEGNLPGSNVPGSTGSEQVPAPGQSAPEVPPAANTEVTLGPVEVQGVPGLHTDHGALYEGRTLILNKDGVDALSKSLKSHFIFVDKSGRKVEPDIIYHQNGTITVVDANNHREVLIQNARFGSSNGHTELIAQERGMTVTPGKDGVTTITFNEEGGLVTKPVDLTAITGEIKQYMSSKGTTQLGPIQVQGLEPGPNGTYEIGGIPIPKADMDALKARLNDFVFEDAHGNKLSEPPVLSIIPGHGLTLSDQNGNHLIDHIGVKPDASGHLEFTFTREHATIQVQNGQIVIREAVVTNPHAQEYRLPIDFENPKQGAPGGNNGTLPPPPPPGAEYAQVGPVEIQGVVLDSHGNLVDAKDPHHIILSETKFKALSGELEKYLHIEKKGPNGELITIDPRIEVTPKGIELVDPAANGGKGEVIFDNLHFGRQVLKRGEKPHILLDYSSLPLTHKVDMNGLTLIVDESGQIKPHAPFDINNFLADMDKLEHGQGPTVKVGPMQVRGLDEIYNAKHDKVIGLGLGGHILIPETQVTEIGDYLNQHVEFVDAKGNQIFPVLAWEKSRDGFVVLNPANNRAMIDYVSFTHGTGKDIALRWNAAQGIRGEVNPEGKIVFTMDPNAQLAPGSIDFTKMAAAMEGETGYQVGPIKIAGLEDVPVGKRNLIEIGGQVITTQARAEQVGQELSKYIHFQYAGQDGKTFTPLLRFNPKEGGWTLEAPDGRTFLDNVNISAHHGQLELHWGAARGLTAHRKGNQWTFYLDEKKSHLVTENLPIHQIDIPLKTLFEFAARDEAGPHGPVTNVTSILAADLKTHQLTTLDLHGGRMEMSTGDLYGTDGKVSAKLLKSYETYLPQIHAVNASGEAIAGTHWVYDGGNGFRLIDGKGNNVGDFYIDGNNNIDVVGTGALQVSHGQVVYTVGGESRPDHLPLSTFHPDQEEVLTVTSNNEIIANVNGHTLTLDKVTLNKEGDIVNEKGNKIIDAKDVQGLLTGGNLKKLTDSLSSFGMNDVTVTYEKDGVWSVPGIPFIGKVEVHLVHDRNGNPTFEIVKKKNGGGGNGGPNGSPSPTPSASSGSPSPSPSGSVASPSSSASSSGPPSGAPHSASPSAPESPSQKGATGGPNFFSTLNEPFRPAERELSDHLVAAGVVTGAGAATGAAYGGIKPILDSDIPDARFLTAEGLRSERRRLRRGNIYRGAAVGAGAGFAAAVGSAVAGPIAAAAKFGFEAGAIPGAAFGAFRHVDADTYTRRQRIAIRVRRALSHGIGGGLVGAAAATGVEQAGGGPLAQLAAAMAIPSAAAYWTGLRRDSDLRNAVEARRGRRNAQVRERRGRLSFRSADRQAARRARQGLEALQQDGIRLQMDDRLSNRQANIITGNIANGYLNQLIGLTPGAHMDIGFVENALGDAFRHEHFDPATFGDAATVEGNITRFLGDLNTNLNTGITVGRGAENRQLILAPEALAKFVDYLANAGPRGVRRDQIQRFILGPFPAGREEREAQQEYQAQMLQFLIDPREEAFVYQPGAAAGGTPAAAGGGRRLGLDNAALQRLRGQLRRRAGQGGAPGGERRERHLRPRNRRVTQLAQAEQIRLEGAGIHLQVQDRNTNRRNARIIALGGAQQQGMIALTEGAAVDTPHETDELVRLLEPHRFFDRFPGRTHAEVGAVVGTFLNELNTDLNANVTVQDGFEARELRLSPAAVERFARYLWDLPADSAQRDTEIRNFIMGNNQSITAEQRQNYRRQMLAYLTTAGAVRFTFRESRRGASAQAGNEVATAEAQTEPRGIPAVPARTPARRRAMDRMRRAGRRVGSELRELREDPGGYLGLREGRPARDADPAVRAAADTAREELQRDRGITVTGRIVDSRLPQLADDIAARFVFPVNDADLAIRGVQPALDNAIQILPDRITVGIEDPERRRGLNAVWEAFNTGLHLPAIQVGGVPATLRADQRVADNLARLAGNPPADLRPFVAERIWQFRSMTPQAQAETIAMVTAYLRNTSDRDNLEAMQQAGPPERIARPGREFTAAPGAVDKLLEEVPEVRPPDAPRGDGQSFTDPDADPVVQAADARGFLRAQRIRFTEDAGDPSPDPTVIAMARRYAQNYIDVAAPDSRARAATNPAIPDVFRGLAVQMEEILNHGGRLHVTTEHGPQQLILNAEAIARLNTWARQAQADPIERDNIRRHITEMATRDPQDRQRTLEESFAYLMGERDDHPRAGQNTQNVVRQGTRLEPVAQGGPTDQGATQPEQAAGAGQPDADAYLQGRDLTLATRGITDPDRIARTRDGLVQAMQADIVDVASPRGVGPSQQMELGHVYADMQQPGDNPAAVEALNELLPDVQQRLTRGFEVQAGGNPVQFVFGDAGLRRFVELIQNPDRGVAQWVNRNIVGFNQLGSDSARQRALFELVGYAVTPGAQPPRAEATAPEPAEPREAGPGTGRRDGPPNI